MYVRKSACLLARWFAAGMALVAASVIAIPAEVRDWPTSLQMDKTSNLAGADRDGNGVRDDIDEWLKLTYSKAPSELRAGRQLAKAIRSVYLASSPQSLGVADAASIQASRCLQSVIPPSTRSKDFEYLFNHLEAFHANTDERSKHFFGVVPKLPRSETSQSPKTGQSACE